MTDPPSPSHLIRSARGAVSDALADTLALVLPVDCVGCGTPDRALCRVCRRGIRASPIDRTLTDGTWVVAGAAYDGVLARAIAALKDADRTELAGPLAGVLAVAVRTALDRARHGDDGPDRPRPVELCPIPSTRAALRRRGFEPLRLLLARAGCRAPRLLRATSRRSDQRALGVTRRAENVAGTMSARRRLDGRRLVLVDDVMTTGATLAEAVRAVSDAGGVVVGAVVLASTPKRSGAG